MEIRKKIYHLAGRLILVIVIALIIGLIASKCGKDEPVSPEIPPPNPTADRSDTKKPEKDTKLQISSLPDKLTELLKNNPETRSFVLNYPQNKNKEFQIDLSEYKNSNEVPLLLQWDERWGYHPYSGDLLGLTGCGPTCLSMVSIHLLNNEQYSPKYIAEFSEKNGYSVPGSGSSWRLISEGGKQLGLNVKELPLDENRIIKNLEVGNPIVCIMGPGDFTTSGHFVVMTKCVDGKIKINDPNSKARSEKLWNLSDIKNQIRNLWVCYV